MKIAIVDDSAILRAAIKNTLETSGFDVVCVAEGSEGLFSYLKTGEADALLLDVFFPNESGLDILEAVKKQYKDIKVIVITGMNQQSKTQEARRRGADEIMYKPFGSQDLMDILERFKK
jgi:DNA-binding response OmpR family regulator